MSAETFLFFVCLGVTTIVLGALFAIYAAAETRLKSQVEKQPKDIPQLWDLKRPVTCRACASLVYGVWIEREGQPDQRQSVWCGSCEDYAGEGRLAERVTDPERLKFPVRP